MLLEINQTWNGHPLAPPEHASVRLSPSEHALILDVDAPYRGDPAPPYPPGPTDRLWEHEVVEAFLLGEDLHYLEIELGPHRHHLVLRLHGIRRRVSAPLAIDYVARIDHAARRWIGRASLPYSYLPEGVRAANAYAIHGPASARCHHAAFPLPGDTPDFHHPPAFGACDLSLP